MRNKRVIRWAVAIVIVACLFVWYRKRKAAKAEGEVIPPEYATVERGEIRQTVVASGIIEPETKVEVKSNAGGEVTALYVDVGDVVKAGDLLARIDPEESLTAVRTASADLQSAQANVAQSRVAAEMERQLAPARVQSALEGVRSARARLKQAEENLAVARAGAESDVTDAEEGVRSAAARLRSTELGRQRDDTQLELALADAEQSEIEAAARHAQAQANLEYQREQYETGLEKAKQALVSAEARLQVARAQAETRPASAAAAVREAAASLEQSRQQLDRLRSATLAENAAAVRGDFESARVTMANAEADLRRQRELYNKGYVPLSQVESAEVQYASARRQFEVAEQQWQTLQQRQDLDLKDAEANVRRAEAALERSRAAEREANTANLDLQAAEAAAEQARADLRQAEAAQTQVSVRAKELEAATAALVRAQNARRSAQARQVEAEIRAAGVTEADAAAVQARAARERAFANRRNVAIRQAEVEAARSSLVQAEASYKQALAQRGQVAERQAAVGQAVASIARREAELSNAQEQLGDTTIVAPRDGVVIEKFVEEGTIITSGRSAVTEGTRILTIADVTKLYCLAEVDEADVARVQPGQNATLKVEAFGDVEFKAVVRKVYPQGVTESDVTQFTVELEVAKTQQMLRPGMTAEIEIETLRKENVLQVPAEAVREGPKGFYVLVDKGAEAEPEEVPVKVGIQTFDAVELLDGIAEGTKVVLALGGPAEEAQPNGGPGGSRQSDRNSPQRQFQRSMRGLGGGPPGMRGR